MSKTTNILVSFLISVAVVIGAHAIWPGQVAQLGGRIETIFTTFGQGFETIRGASVIKTGSTLAIGTNGTAVKSANFRICYIRPYAASIAGGASAHVDCQGAAGWDATGWTASTTALTGVSADQFVTGVVSTTTADNLATTTAVANLVVTKPLQIVAVSASSTAGYIDLELYNASTSPYVWPVGKNASGTAFFLSATQ